MGTSQLRCHLLCLAAGWGRGFACRSPPAPALLARGILKPSSHPVLNQQNTIQSKNICSDVTDELCRKYLSCLKKLLPPCLQQRPLVDSGISARTYFDAKCERIAWTVNGKIWGTCTPAPTTARGEAPSAGEGWRLLEGCGGSLSHCNFSVSEQRSQDPKPFKRTIG